MSHRNRIKSILEHLVSHEDLTVEEACQLFDASPATIRRDFNLLMEKGEVDKFWGGIKARQNKKMSNSMMPVFYRESINMVEKKRIAQKAASMIEDGEVIIIDGGSTTMYMAEYIANKNIKIITNSILIASQIDLARDSQEGAEVFLTGGSLFPSSGLLVGPQANANIRQYNAGKAFLSVGGLSEFGVTNSSQLVSETEQTIIEQSKELIVLADHSKFNINDMCKVCDISDIDVLITDESPDINALLRIYAEKNITIERV